MGHHCCSKQKVKRGLWSPEEDEMLATHITTHGHGCWSSIPKLTGLQRCGKSCRLRWINYLRPDLKRGSFNEDEERTIIDVHRMLGNRWSQIAKHLPGRTDNEVKNFWNSCIKKKLISQGFDPNTHNLLSPNKKHTKITTKKATPSLFSISTTTSYDNCIDANYVDMKTPLVSMSPSVLPLSNENSTLFTANVATRTTFDVQNPNFVSNFETKNSHCLTEVASQQRDVSSGLGVLDEKVMWGTGIQPFELTRQEEMQHHQYQHQHEQLYENCGVEEALIGKSNGQNMGTSFMESSNFDFEFNESAFTPYGMYCNVSPMDQFAWDC